MTSFPRSGTTGSFSHILIYSLGRCHSNIIRKFLPQLNTGQTSPLFLRWPWPHAISSSQRAMLFLRWGSLPSRTCECRSNILQSYCTVRGYRVDTMCIFFITFFHSFYFLLLFSKRIIFLRIGKSGSLLSLLN